MGIFCLLIVNDDFRCQHIASQVLQRCNYEELYTGRIMDALNAISEIRDRLNPVLITNMHRLGEKGSQILNQIQAQLNFEMIYMTPDDQMVEFKRSEEMSISAYAVNISNLEDINCLWKSIVAKQKAFNQEETPAPMAIEETTEAASGVGGNDDDGNESSTHQKRKRKETKELTEQSSQVGGNGGGDDHPVEKKPRVVWTKEMHRKFLEAIEILGPDKTFPKKIVELMNEPGLTRENVASHLQKYRLCLKRNQEEAAAANSNNGLNNPHPCFFSSSFHPFGYPYRQGSCGMISSMPSLGLSSPFTSYASSYPFTSFRICGDEKTKNTIRDGCLSTNANAAAAMPWNSENVKSFIGLRFTNDGKSLEFGQTTTTSGSGSGNNNEIQNEMFSSAGTEITEHSNSLEPPPNTNTLSENSSHRNYMVSDYSTPQVFTDCNDFEQEQFLALPEESPLPVLVPVPVPDDYYCTFQQSHDDDDESLPVLLNNSTFLHDIPTSWNNPSPELPQPGNISSLEHLSSGASMDENEIAAHSVFSVVSTTPRENSFPVILGGGTTSGNGTFSVQESSISPSQDPYQIPVQESSVPLPAQALQDDDFDCFLQPVEDINSFLNETAECSNPQLFWKGVYDYAYNNHPC